MAKRTFASRTWANRTFASGTWAGVGSAPVPPRPTDVIAGAGLSAGEREDLTWQHRARERKKKRRRTHDVAVALLLLSEG